MVTDYASRIQVLDCSKLAIYLKMAMTPQFTHITSSSNVFDIVLFLLSGLVTGPSFMSIIISGSGVMAIFFYEGLSRKPEIGYNSV